MKIIFKKTSCIIVLVFSSVASSLFCSDDKSSWQVLSNMGFTRLSLAQEILVREAKKQADFDKSVQFLSGSGAQYRKDSQQIVIDKTHNLYGLLFGMYHEMGHAVHHNRYKEKSFDEISDDPLFKAEMQKIIYYTRLGQEVIDGPSRIGLFIKDAIKKVKQERELEASSFLRRHTVPVLISLAAPILIPLMTYALKSKNLTNVPQAFKEATDRFVQLLLFSMRGEIEAAEARESYPFWIKIKESSLEVYSYGRSKEQDADLFACTNLFKSNQIGVIIDRAVRYATCDQKIDSYEYKKLFAINRKTYSFFNVHPSDLERAVYILGFLAAHGLDVNAALREYEARGTCTDAEDLTAILAYISQGQKNYTVA